MSEDNKRENVSTDITEDGNTDIDYLQASQEDEKAERERQEMIRRQKKELLKAENDISSEGEPVKLKKSIWRRIFKTHSEREIKRIQKLADAIEKLEPEMKRKSDEELRAMTDIFKKRLAEGETLDDILVEAYAVVREAAVRTLALRAFRVQLLGAIILHQGRIAEMFTGEGKTLTSAFPVYLNALEGLGVHVVTVNDYLAKRDAENMGQIYEFLGVSCKYILNSMDPDGHREAYNADITYGTNNEFGFDYLRDNMQVEIKGRVQRGLHFAVIDEVDSILIDEARTPLIISGRGEKSTNLYEQCDRLAKRLQKGTAKELSKQDQIYAAKFGGLEEEETGDFVVDEKEKNINLTAEGVKKVEEYFKIENYADLENQEIQHGMVMALRANYIMIRDHDYVVQDDQILIVDDFTGRILPGRRYSDGLHQAIEAKEGVKVNRENKTLLTITLQNYFNKYDKKCGMTGTALTEDQEFREIYGMDVVSIPTNRPIQRIDHDDAVFTSHNSKMVAIVNAVTAAHEKGQPVLVGTVSIEASEEISRLLQRAGIKHEVLNAKFHEREAEIIAQAGRLGAVTVATNMAGRGTDIKLGGDLSARMKKFDERMEKLERDAEEKRARDAKKKGGRADDRQSELDHEEEMLEKRRAYLEQAKKERDEEAALVRAAGGLCIIGTERHEARRIDNQLRGRSGRQGDPGESKFYISLDDDLIRLFATGRRLDLIKAIRVPEGEELQHGALTSLIERAQKKIEGNHFGIRKNLLEYDQVNNEQREIIFAERNRVLEGENMHDSIFRMMLDTVERSIDSVIRDDALPEEWDMEALKSSLRTVIPYTEDFFEIKDPENAKKNELKHVLKTEAERLYQIAADRFAETGMEFREIERTVLLNAIDKRWRDHIDDMDMLRQSIGLQAFAQRNPVDEYKMQGFDMFEEMTIGIEEDTVRGIFLAAARPTIRIERKKAEIVGTNHDDDSVSRTVRRSGMKIMPNDPCPCGSGRKFKQCCKGKGVYD